MANIQVPAKYRRLLRAATGQAGIPYEVGAAQIQDESGFDPNVTSPAGAEGIAQFEPGTWKEYGYGSPYNPRRAFPAYGRYMQALMYDEGGSLRNALAAYNAGPNDVPAGYGYADKILSEAGPTSGGGGGSEGPPGAPVPYRNPFRSVKPLSPERIDMGVDYQGQGPIYAPGPGVITESDNAWSGGVGAVGPGTFITERLTEGPLKGKYVYFAENIDPRARVGQRVDTNTIIGEMTGQGAGIETGFAAGPTGGETLAQATGQASTSGDPGANTTAYGRSWSNILSFLGAPPGVQGGPDTGTLPANWWQPAGAYVGSSGGGSSGGLPGWINDIPIVGPILATGQDTAHGLAAIAAVLGRVEHFIEWWAMPSNWFRIFAGVAGSGLVVLGVTALARPRVNLPVLGSTPVVPAGELGPAFGIASVTGGAVLLFFAFHNTGVGSWAELLNAVRDRIHGQPVPVQS